MIRLTLFGQRDLVDGNSQPIAAVLRQPKAFALLVYLALAGPDGTTRTSVTGRAVRTGQEHLSLSAITGGRDLPEPELR